MDIIKEIEDSDEETNKDELVLITDADSDEETLYTYATFATCEEAEEVVASMRFHIEPNPEEEVNDNEEDEVYDNGLEVYDIKEEVYDNEEEVYDNKVEVIVDESGNDTTMQTVDTDDVGCVEDVDQIIAVEETDNNVDIYYINTSEQEDNENPTEEEEYEINLKVDEPEYDNQPPVWHTVPSTETNYSDAITQAGEDSYEIHDNQSNGVYENMSIDAELNCKSNTCPYCGNNHRSAGSLKLHMQACRRKKFPEQYQRQCKICDKTFQDAKFLKQHLLLRHYEAYCTRCFRSFRNSKKLKEHIEEHKLQDEQSPNFDGSNLKVKAYTCCNCSKQFSVVYVNGCLKRRFVCDPCRDMFANVEKAKQTKKGAKRESGYSCSSCERKFVFMGSLQRHMDECNNKSLYED